MVVKKSICKSAQGLSLLLVEYNTAAMIGLEAHSCSRCTLCMTCMHCSDYTRLQEVKQT